MSSVKESLYKAVELLSDEESQRVLEFTQSLQRKSNISQTLKRLEKNSNFRLPSEGVADFGTVNPVKGKGIAASKLLVENRR